MVELVELARKEGEGAMAMAVGTTARAVGTLPRAVGLNAIGVAVTNPMDGAKVGLLSDMGSYITGPICSSSTHEQ